MSRTPARSFYHRSFHGQLDTAQYSSEGLRDQTAELASLALSDHHPSSNVDSFAVPPIALESDDGYPDVIEEVSEPVTPEERAETQNRGDPVVSSLTKLIQAGPESMQDRSEDTERTLFDRPRTPNDDEESVQADENTSLLSDRKASLHYGDLSDVERQHKHRIEQGSRWRPLSRRIHAWKYTLSHPKTWSARAIYHEVVVHPVKLLPAVFLGLLLNILDALSYGMIMFPLGNAMFDDLGSDGIALFYVSTIVSQIVYSAGGSVFKGGIGSEMIEVTPFFHKMAFTILNKVGPDNSKAVLATTILSFSLSTILTGTVFFLMGACKLGSLIGFFPRHILIGCIGGVGFFLFVTGIEVSARLEGNLNYDIDTLKKLFQADTVALWLIPLALAVILLTIQRFVKSNLLVGGYFISVAIIFYFFKFALDIPMETLHGRGWTFDSPPAGHPWYHFYTLYDFKAVDWAALGETVPAMFALTFFGILHVPINVPALGISTGEDNLNVDRELIAHGISNCLSGCFGSIQNYLVYTNSLLFMDSGGNDRLAGLMLAAATFGILLSGPVIIGLIPVMVVGALIFLLGIELLEEALVGTWGRVHRLEYATILIIVVTMGVWDFVMGILIGIILAALSFVVQTSRRTAIRATYTGEIANSTVRRPPLQQRYLKQAGSQVFVIKLAGFLFFGTIVGVENRIRALLDEDAFESRLLQFLVLDMTSINGIDYSAAEAFTRVNRLLRKRNVRLVVSGLDLEGETGQALRNVGLFEDELGVEFFATLNEALEHCENRLLTAFYRHQEHRAVRRNASHLEVPKPKKTGGSIYPPELMMSSPRQNQLHRVAQTTLDEDTSSSSKWQMFKQPLPLMMQMFEDLSDKSEDFWQRATTFFERIEYSQGSVLFSIGERAIGFYLLEEGLVRAEYELPQGTFSELIVSGLPFGELPFFSETTRTATMFVDKDSVVWQLNAERWHQLQSKEPEVAQELLKIGLKLTKERMDVVTSYILTAAG
jgi:sulfate permease, SulP family